MESPLAGESLQEAPQTDELPLQTVKNSDSQNSSEIHPWDSIHLYAETLAGHFTVGAEIDLRMLSASVTTVEYNPSSSCAKMRLVDPGCTVNVYASGACFLMGIASVRDMLKASGLVVAILRALGYHLDQVSPLRVMCSVFSGAFPFGVKLDELAAENDFCLYDPEIYSMLMYRPSLSNKIEVCMTIAANGSFIIAGARTVEIARTVLRCIYPDAERHGIPCAGAPQNLAGSEEGEEVDLLRSNVLSADKRYLLDPRAIISASDIADLSETMSETGDSTNVPRESLVSDRSPDGSISGDSTRSENSEGHRAGGPSKAGRARRRLAGRGAAPGTLRAKMKSFGAVHQGTRASRASRGSRSQQRTHTVQSARKPK